MMIAVGVVDDVTVMEWVPSHKPRTLGVDSTKSPHKIAFELIPQV